jgi:hypothetical protein
MENLTELNGQVDKAIKALLESKHDFRAELEKALQSTSESSYEHSVVSVDSIIPHPSFFDVTKPYPNKDNFERYCRSIVALLVVRPFWGNINEIRLDKTKLTHFNQRLLQELHRPPEYGETFDISWKNIQNQVNYLILFIETRLKEIERLSTNTLTITVHDMLLVDRKHFFDMLDPFIKVRDYVNKKGVWIVNKGWLNGLVGELMNSKVSFFKPEFKRKALGVAFAEYYGLEADGSNFRPSKDKGLRLFKDVIMDLERKFQTK